MWRAAALPAALPERSICHRRLATIPGVVPGAGDRPDGCLFNPRCHLASDTCRAKPPALAPSLGAPSLGAPSLGPDQSGRVRCHTPLNGEAGAAA